MRTFTEIQTALPKLLIQMPIQKAYLLGSTGAGKTSIIREIMGSKQYDFPAIDQSRTTLVTTEYVLGKSLPFKTTILLKKEKEILDSIEDLIKESILSVLRNKNLENTKKSEYLIEKMKESSDERFRLSYMIKDDDFRKFADHILNKILPNIVETNIDKETLFSSNIEREINILGDLIYKEAKKTFDSLLNEISPSEEGELLFLNFNNREESIQKNKKLLSNAFGSIILFVDYIRIEGDLLAHELNKDENFSIMLIDGEGIGHSLQEERNILASRHYDYFDFCDQILLVEKSDDPFISGGQGAIEAIFLSGYEDKFKLIFSKIDKIEREDKNSFISKSVDNLTSALEKTLKGFNLNLDCVYKIGNLHKDTLEQKTKDEIYRLLKDIKNPKEIKLEPLEFDFSNLFLEFNSNSFVDNFSRFLTQEHWAVVKAFSKRMYECKEGYRYIQPISLVHRFIMQDIDKFLVREDIAQLKVYNSRNKIKQDFSNFLKGYIYKKLIKEKNFLWQNAYEYQGIGSHKKRIKFIAEDILKVFLPSKDDKALDDKAFTIFKEDIKKLLTDSGAMELTSAIKIVIEKIDIKGVYGYKNFIWKLNENTNILLGKNGSGKSTILKLIYACLESNESVFKFFGNPYITLNVKKEYENKSSSTVEIKNFHSHTGIKIKIIDTFDIHFSSVDEQSTTLDCKLESLLQDLSDYQRNLKYKFDTESKELKVKANKILSKIENADIAELKEYKVSVTDIKKIEEKTYEKVSLFEEIINDLFFKETNKYISLKEINEPLVVKHNKGISVDINKLSSGEKQLLIIFITVLIEDEKPFILLMDEPESSLHVEWQSIVIDKLKELNANMQIIAATHNPLIALNKKPEEIGVIEINTDKINTNKMGTEFLDVSSTLLNYFGLSSLVGSIMKNKLAKLFELKTQTKDLSQKNLEKLDQLEKELGSTLASNFIYDRHYLHFLRFIYENKNIDFDKLAKISEKEMDELLAEFKDLFK